MSGHRRPVAPPPLPADVDLVLVDGNNLLHRARGVPDEAGIRWLIPLLRTWRPPGAQIVLVLDGHPDPGEMKNRAVVTGIAAVHSGAIDADTSLLRRLEGRPYGDRIRTLLVTDDRALSDKARREHAIVRRLDWFLDELQRARASGGPAALGPATAPAGAPPASVRLSGFGAGRPPAPRTGTPPDAGDGEASRRPWTPGRGATRKRGNPRRGHPGA